VTALLIQTRGALHLVGVHFEYAYRVTVTREDGTRDTIVVQTAERIADLLAELDAADITMETADDDPRGEVARVVEAVNARLRAMH
jgi:hypothetical protein